MDSDSPNSTKENKVTNVNFSEFVKQGISKIIIDTLREFGIVGVVTYIGGVTILVNFRSQPEVISQSIYAITGVILLSLATFISYTRIKAQSMREKYLIDMVQNSCNRLAEQLGKSLTEKQIEGITQKIRQLLRDLISAIFSNSIEKWNKL